ncbi:MAG: hypothetical protein JO117_10300 [Verrucomicrobia bacterium]|nr:hypothetical protein [Verrucomicrobiota bacterium]MBV9658187.1 hypothetical protein [Verrucomicrobiota bacterium]
MKNSPPATSLRDEKQVSLALDPAASALSVQQVLGQVQLIQQILASTMKEGEHYGRIPGCGDKPTLLKPGAEKLCLTFRLAPAYNVEERQLERGHREYRVLCTLSSITTGAFIGQGLGTCSSLEAKYRFRAGQGEPTERPVPRAYWDLRQEDPAKAQELLGGKGFSTRKIEGKGWMICQGGEKVENDNPADTFNTVLKMAKKRALVDAVLTATAASDIFTQDLEDISANLAAHPPVTAAASATTAVEEEQTEIALDPPRSPAESGKSSSRRNGTSGRRTQQTQQPTDVDLETDKESGSDADFREARVHFGKNRGLTLSELTPNQVHWYETEWMPKKETSGMIGQDDLALMQALKAYRHWRDQQKSRSQSNGSSDDNEAVDLAAARV